MFIDEFQERRQLIVSERLREDAVSASDKEAVHIVIERISSDTNNHVLIAECTDMGGRFNATLLDGF
jgi:fructose-1,6-bisphosphatase/inositol monophosphatase family enzyme